MTERVLPLPPEKKSRTGLVVLGVVVFIAFSLFYHWANSVDSVDLVAAQKVIDNMLASGELESRSCRPNRAVIPRSVWLSIPNETTKENLMNALARICLEESRTRDMTLVDETGRVLAQFDGWNIVK